MTEALASADTPEGRLARLGLELPPAPSPYGDYVPISVASDFAFLSGMVPVFASKAQFVGVVGETLSPEAGKRACRLAALNALSVLRQKLGSLDRVAKAVRLVIYLRATAEFGEHPPLAPSRRAASAQPHAHPSVGLPHSGVPTNASPIFRKQSLSSTTRASRREQEAQLRMGGGELKSTTPLARSGWGPPGLRPLHSGRRAPVPEAPPPA